MALILKQEKHTKRTVYLLFFLSLLAPEINIPKKNRLHQEKQFWKMYVSATLNSPACSVLNQREKGFEPCRHCPFANPIGEWRHKLSSCRIQQLHDWDIICGDGAAAVRRCREGIQWHELNLHMDWVCARNRITPTSRRNNAKNRTQLCCSRSLTSKNDRIVNSRSRRHAEFDARDCLVRVVAAVCPYEVHVHACISSVMGVNAFKLIT